MDQELNCEIEHRLLQMSSFEAIKYVLHDIELHDIQCIDVVKMLYMQRCLVIYDTGLGKTLLTAAFIKLLCNEDPTRKFIMFVKKDQLIQTPKKIYDACGKLVITASAEAKSVKAVLANGLNSATVLMLTHTCLDNEPIMMELFKKRNEFCGVIIDEAHELNNFNKTQSGSMLEAICGSFEYCIALTATPIITSALQLSKIAHIVSPKRYPNYNKLKKQLLSGSFDIAQDPLFFISRSGEDFGSTRDYRGYIKFVKPHPEQMTARGSSLLKLCKGPGAENQVEALVELITERTGQRGLVYINQHEVRAWVLPFLDEAGVKYDCINGMTKSVDRAHIMRQFNNERTLDVVVTSVTTAIDLDCDYVIFYEFTPYVKQMIGRAHRGLGDKRLDIVFVVTEDTDEIEYFFEHVIKQSFLARDILHKNYSEIEDVNFRLLEHEDGVPEKVYR